jgi:membrane-bound inhibitor of C-type lysozyme
VLVWNSGIAVATSSRLLAFSADGKLLWQRNILSGSPAVVANDLIYYQNPRHRLEAVTLDETPILANAYFPGAYDPLSRVWALWPEKNEFLAVTQFIGLHRENPPWTSVYKAVYGSRVPLWDHDYPGGPLLPPLLVRRLNRIVLLMRELITIDPGTGTEVSRAKLPLTSYVDWSAGPEGDLYVLGSPETGCVLACVSLDGKTRWTSSGLGASTGWVKTQPPIVRPDGTVHVFGDRSVLTYRNGSLLWESATPGETPRYGTALADGTLMVAAGRTLHRLDADGNTMFSVTLEGEILTPPGVDASGSVYVATATHLVKIQ